MRDLEDSDGKDGNEVFHGSGEFQGDELSRERVAQQDGVPAVRFENVGLTYKNAGAESLTDINFTAYKGQTIGVIGGPVRENLLW